jgi:hypothetical protein
MIIKVQRPRASTDPKSPWLFYDKPRFFISEIPESDLAALRKKMGSAVKAYFESEIVGTKLVIGKRLKDQNW